MLENPSFLLIDSKEGISDDGFNLQADNQLLIQQRTDEIKNLIRRTASNLIEIGKKLHEVKQLLGHGNFGNWLLTEFNWSVATATKMMQASERFENVNFTNLNFAPSAIYLLAAPSTPKKAITEALTQARGGKPITYTFAKQIVDHHKSRTQSSKPKRQSIFESSSILESKVSLIFFEQYTMREWLRLKREKKNFSLVVCTIDNLALKKEQVLETQIEGFSQIVCQEIRKSLHRSTDIFTEYKPGIFLILLSNTSPKGVQKVVQTIKKNINLKQRKCINNHESWIQSFTVIFKDCSVVPSSEMTLNKMLASFLMSNQESFN
jgi:GGDEF domain-containing protein